MAATGLQQQPWLDDNGDAVANSLDGLLARSRGLKVAGGRAQVIDWVRVGSVVSGHAPIQAQVRDDGGASSVSVWVEVYPPDFVEPPPSVDGNTPNLNLPKATLTPMGTDVYSVTYAGFTRLGQYRLVTYAQDADGQQALPQSVHVCAGCVYLPLILREIP